jgi:hypothetical protein
VNEANRSTEAQMPQIRQVLNFLSNPRMVSRDRRKEGLHNNQTIIIASVMYLRSNATIRIRESSFSNS